MKYSTIHAILIINVVVITITISSDANLDISKNIDDYYYDDSTTTSTTTKTTKKTILSKTNMLSPLIKTLKKPHSTGSFSSLAVLTDDTLASCIDNKNIDIWNIQEGNIVRSLKGHADTILTLALMHDGVLASGSLDKTIKIWKNYEITHTLKGHSDFVWTLVGLANYLLASASNDNTIKIWNILNGKLIKTFNSSKSRIMCLNVKDDTLISGTMNGKIDFWSVSKETIQKTIHGHANAVTSVTVFNKNKLATSSGDTTIKIWNFLNGDLIRILSCHSNWVYSLVVLKNDSILASSSADQTIKLWNIDNGLLLNTFTGHTDLVFCLAVLKDGNLASSSWDKTIKLWNTSDEIITHNNKKSKIIVKSDYFFNKSNIIYVYNIKFSLLIIFYKIILF